MKLSYTGTLLACLAFSLCFTCAAEPVASSQASIEKEIKTLEAREARAVLEHDVASLEQLWDAAFVVHNPEGKIVPAGRSVTERPVLQNRRSSFLREVESVVVQGDVAISMGSETLVPLVDSGASGEVIKRRYTNIWMKKGDTWKLVARHANKI